MRPANADIKPILHVVDVPDEPPAALQRARGTARLSFKLAGTRSVLDDLYQTGCMKVRLPRRTADQNPEAVLINTSGGLTDNDELDVACTWQAGTSAVITTQACERIYRSRQADARVLTKLGVQAGARANWLPQETILFEGGRLDRHTHVDLEDDAGLVACEAVILGRPAMGERVHSGSLNDKWTIKRNGKLVFADRFGLTGDLTAKLARKGIGNGAEAWATIIMCGGDLECSRSQLVPVLEACGCPAACSNLGEVLLIRMLASNGYELRKALMRALGTARHDRALPGVWSM